MLTVYFQTAGVALRSSYSGYSALLRGLASVVRVSIDISICDSANVSGLPGYVCNPCLLSDMASCLFAVAIQPHSEQFRDVLSPCHRLKHLFP